MLEISLLLSALLFGGMVLYSFGFAAFVFSALPATTAGPLIRKAFPHFYLFVFGASVLAACLAAFLDPASALILATIASTTVIARQILMPGLHFMQLRGTARQEAHRDRWKVQYILYLSRSCHQPVHLKLNLTRLCSQLSAISSRARYSPSAAYGAKGITVDN